MLQSAVGYLRDRWPFRHGLHLPVTDVERIIQECRAEPWHLYAIRKRIWRRHVCAACGWIADYLPTDASVFEPGCGSGANLLWLAERGFSRLQGTDISPRAVALCRELARCARIDMQVRQDDGLRPAQMPENVDVILSVNWLYHIPGASLETFLDTYRPGLARRGKIVCDVVDAAYNAVPGNQYHTSDEALPVEQRRPSEYTFRMSREEVADVAASSGFRVLRDTRFSSVRPQRAVYMLEKYDPA